MQPDHALQDLIWQVIDGETRVRHLDDARRALGVELAKLDADEALTAFGRAWWLGPDGDICRRRLVHPGESRGGPGEEAACSK